MVNAVPSSPGVKISTLYTNTKSADPDIILTTSDDLEPELMADLLFEDIGGEEIINISRHDLINGQDVIYSPIKNLSSINRQYNPQNIIAVQSSSDVIFKNYPIKFEKYLPQFGTGPNKEIVYIEPSTGNIIINLVDLPSGEQVEVQILDAGAILDDTIYGEQL